MTRNIAVFTDEDAAAVIGRPLTDDEYRNVVKAAEFLFSEEFVQLVESVVSDSNDELI